MSKTEKIVVSTFFVLVAVTVGLILACIWLPSPALHDRLQDTAFLTGSLAAAAMFGVLTIVG